MKTLLMTVAEATPTKNLMRGTFWFYLNQNRNFRIVIITSKEKQDLYKKEFQGRDIIVESFPALPVSWLEKILIFIARNALKTGTVTFNQMRKYHSGGGILQLAIKRLMWHVLGRSKSMQNLVRRLEFFLSPPDAVKIIFDKYHPDLVFSTIAIHLEIDTPVLREAKRRGIRTIAMLRGWDNFTSHGFLRVVPDLFLLQNKYLYKAGVKDQFLDPSKMRVVGWPQNDWYFRRDLIEPRDIFLKKLGLDPKKRLILFGAMGDFLFPKEGEIAEIFEELVRRGKIPQDLVMVFRAHPSFASPLEKMKGMKYVAPDRDAQYFSSRVESWEMGEKEAIHLMNSIFHSELAMTSGSTIALDAVVMDKPTISVAFEKTKTPYWFSARRFRDHYTHYEDMMRTGGVRAVDNPPELAAAINEYLENPALDKDKRQRLRETFLEPHDGKTGERIARMILEVLS